MGQQQLLLLVLGIVIVGLAVVVGISAFKEGRNKSTVDRYSAVGVEMAGEIIAWYMKPAAQGGGGQQASRFNSLTIDRLGYTMNGGTQSGGWGFRTGSIENGTERWLTVTTGPHPFVHITDSPVVEGMVRVEVHVFGPKRECVVTRNDLYGATTWSDGTASGELPANPNPSACSW